MAQEIKAPRAEQIVNRWIIWRWRLSASPTKLALEGWCQAVRGGEIAEICGARFVSPCPLRVPLHEIELLLAQTHEERLAEIAAREPKDGEPEAFARKGAPVACAVVQWDEATGRRAP